MLRGDISSGKGGRNDRSGAGDRECRWLVRECSEEVTSDPSIGG